MENEKKYVPVNELAEYLKVNKKIIVKENQEMVFNEKSYQSLINPYKDFFSFGKGKEKKRVYRNNTDLCEYMKVAKLDDDFSSLLYLYIGVFERKFKTLLFKEICDKYYYEEKDITCTSYVKQIDEFFESNYEKLPIFCPFLFYVLCKKGSVKDAYNTDKKIVLLKHMKELGTGVREDGKRLEKNNKLISHYLKSQKVAPLWMISNALTFGELQQLFLMLDLQTKRKIVGHFFEQSYRKMKVAHLLSFSGHLETIRNMRNIVNHYEPIIPFLTNNMKQAKRIEKTQIFSTLTLLENVYNNSKIKDAYYENIKVDENSYTTKIIRILLLIKDQLNK